MVNKRCNCTEVCLKYKDVSFDTLIEKGLICEACVRNYNEFLKD